MKKLILDYSTWRSGDFGPFRLGEGSTLLLNQEGYSCCLGQFCLQNDFTPVQIFELGSPKSIGKLFPPFNVEREDYEEELSLKRYINTPLSISAMQINDHAYTTPAEKITRLKELLAEHDIELEVINQPKTTE